MLDKSDIDFLMISLHVLMFHKWYMDVIIILFRYVETLFIFFNVIAITVPHYIMLNKKAK